MALETPESDLIEDEGAGYLISVSDLMSGLLMVFIITLMAFVFNFQQAEQKAEAKREKLESVVTKLTNTQEVRARMLREIKEQLAARGIQVKVDEKHGVLHLRENAIRFASGRARLAPVEREKVRTIGRVLASILPCYSANPAILVDMASCSGSIVGKLESVFIEGHTDSEPVGARSPFESNWQLSAERAIEAYKIMREAVPRLMALENTNHQPLFSVTGYGAERPVRLHDMPTADPLNRRIDLRFIMTTPRADTPEVQRDLQEAGVR